jgi:hypothetical protein
LKYFQITADTIKIGPYNPEKRKIVVKLIRELQKGNEEYLYM